MPPHKIPTKPTTRLLKKLEDLDDWFGHVGERWTRDSLKVRIVESWDEANTLADSDKWVNKIVRITNSWAALARTKYGIEWYNNDYSRVIDLHHRLIREPGQRAVGRLPKQFRSNKGPRQIIMGNLACALFESDFPELCPEPFFSILAEVYLAGHFPCGIIGSTLAKGTLVIY